MCGILGFITNESKVSEQTRANFLRQGMIVDTLRGDDSSGIFGVMHGEDKDQIGPYWCKEAVDGYRFVNSTNYLENFCDVAPYRAVVGHNRAATSGDRDTGGAHPFIVGPISLVHNGTLIRSNNLPTPLYNLDDCTVDSHAIAHNLALHSVEDVVKTLDGAYTLIWHDARDNSMNIIRNDQRPLHMTLASNQETIFFASEGGMLDFLCKRLHISIGPVYYPKAGQHLKWLEGCALTAPEVRELEMYTYKYNSQYGANCFTWDDDDDWVYSGRGSSAMREKPYSDNKIWIGGRQKEVPMLLQEQLLNYDLVIEDRLVFTPKIKRTIGEGRAQVFGTLESGLKAVLYSLLGNTANQMDRNWTVRPIGVFVKPSGEPTIIVKLVSTFGKELSEFTPTNNVIGYDINEAGEECRYFGAYGAKYSEREWKTWTAGGCGYCGKVVHIEEHKDIIWINNESTPLCIGCSMDVKDNTGFDDTEEIPYV